MTAQTLRPGPIDRRERLLGAAELACAAWAVIGHSVLGIFPNEVPILVLVVLVAATPWRSA